MCSISIDWTIPTTEPAIVSRYNTSHIHKVVTTAHTIDRLSPAARRQLSLGAFTLRVDQVDGLPRFPSQPAVIETWPAGPRRPSAPFLAYYICVCVCVRARVRRIIAALICNDEERRCGNGVGSGLVVFCLRQREREPSRAVEIGCNQSPGGSDTVPRYLKSEHLLDIRWARNANNFSRADSSVTSCICCKKS